MILSSKGADVSSNACGLLNNSSYSPKIPQGAWRAPQNKVLEHPPYHQSLEVFCKRHLIRRREKVLSLKGGKNGDCFEWQLNWFIGGCLTCWFQVLPAAWMNLMLLLNTHPLFLIQLQRSRSHLYVMFSTVRARRGGKKGKEVTIHGLTTCRISHTNSSFQY